MRPEIQFTPIDLQSWPRGQMFYYFSKMAPTGYSLTVDVDVTRLRTVLKAAGYRFFPAYLWLVTRTLGEQQEFKAAETDGVLGYYNVLTPLYAAFHDDDKTFSLMWTEYDDSFPAFHAAYLADKARWGGHHGVLAKEGQLPRRPTPIRCRACRGSRSVTSRPTPTRARRTISPPWRRESSMNGTGKRGCPCR